MRWQNMVKLHILHYHFVLGYLEYCHRFQLDQLSSDKDTKYFLSGFVDTCSTKTAKDVDKIFIIYNNIQIRFIVL